MRNRSEGTDSKYGAFSFEYWRIKKTNCTCYTIHIIMFTITVVVHNFLDKDTDFVVFSPSVHHHGEFKMKHSIVSEV